MAGPGRWLRDESGAIAVEFALWTALLFFLVSAALDFGIFHLQRGRIDDALAAGAVHAFAQRDTVGFDRLPATIRALAEDDALTVAISCNGGAAPCTNFQRSCSCLAADGQHVAATCSTVCADGASAGYYLTIDARSAFRPVLVPGRVLGGDEIRRAVTLRLD